MKKEKKYIYRIKDLNTGKYYSKRDYCRDSDTDYFKKLKENASYTYKAPYGYSHVTYFLYLDQIGHFYPTRKGAEKMISEFTASKKHERATQAGRLLNARFNFVVVKSELKLKDVDETQNVSTSPKDKPEIAKQV